MRSSLGAGVAVVGLGGAGAKVVQELLEDEPSLRALVVDQEGDESLGPVGESVEFVDVWHRGLDLRKLIAQGAYGDPATASGQQRLRHLSSWRMTLLDAPNLSLQMGSGAYRAVGRMLGLASEQRIRDALSRLPSDCRSVVVIASMSGGFGSALMTDVIEWLLHGRLDLHVHALWLADYPPRVHRLLRYKDRNEAAALLESLSTLDRLGVSRLNYSVVSSESSDFGTERVRAVIGETTGADSSAMLNEALERVAARIFDGTEFVVPGWWRSRPIAESSGLTRDMRQRLIRGYVKAAALGAIRRTEGDEAGPAIFTVLARSGETVGAPLLALPSDQVSPLPRILEIARLALAASPASESIAALLDWADKPIIATRSPSDPGPEASDPAGYERHYLGMVAPPRSSTGDRVGVEAFVAQQLQLVRGLRALPYDGTEGLDAQGRPVPPETLFRDIAKDYEAVLQEMIDDLRAQVELTNGEDEAPDGGAEEGTAVRGRRCNWISQGAPSGRFARNLRPFWAVRYAIPAALALGSVGLFLWALNTGDEGRTSLAGSADVVAGVMAGFAVCLGAIALITSIQNNSVTSVRTDRLFTSCTAVCEAVTMFEVALEKARFTPIHAGVTEDVWSHPSVQLAGRFLRERLDAALSDGLFRLLSARDVQRGTAKHRVNESLAVQVFALFDDLSRAEGMSAEPAGAPPGPAENVCRIACGLREEIQSLTYRAVAQSIRARKGLERVA